MHERGRRMASTGYFGHITVALGEIRGALDSDLALEVELKIYADGFAPGVAAMILPSCHIQGASSPIVLGQASPIVIQVGFSLKEGGGKPYHTSEYARWRVSPTAA